MAAPVRRWIWRLWRAMSSGKSAGAIAKDREWPSNSVRQRVAAHKRGDPAPRYVGGVERRLTSELLDEIRSNSLRIVSYLLRLRPLVIHAHVTITLHVRTVAIRFTLSRSCSRKAIRCLRLRPLVIRTVLHLEDRHIRDRRKFADEVFPRLALASLLQR